MVVKQKNWFLIVIIPFLLGLLYLSRKILAPFLIAFFLAYAINPLVEFLELRGARRVYAILTVYCLLVIVMLIAVGLLLPQMINDLTEALQKLPVLNSEFERLTKMGEGWLNSWKIPSSLRFLTAELIDRVELWIRSLMVSLMEGILNFFSQTVRLILVPVLAFYISRDYPRMKRKSYCWTKRYLGQHWACTYNKMDQVFRLYIRGQLWVTLIVGSLITLGLVLLRVEAAFFLGSLAGIFNLIPYFGPVLGAIPAVVFGLLDSPWTAGYVILLFTIVNQFEIVYLSPKIIGGSLGLHPLLVIYLLLIGGRLFGLWGMIFAVPLGSLIIIILISIYEIAFGLANKEPIG